MNDKSRIKGELIAALDEGRAAARAFVATLPPDLPVHDNSDWTVRDLIIHLTTLEADMITAIQCARDGAAFSVDLRGQADAPALYELRRRDQAHRSWEELLLEWERKRRQLREAALAFPVEEIGTPFSNPFFVEYNLIGAIGACGAHEDQHLAEMRAALHRCDA
jgi:hypothetical protein